MLIPLIWLTFETASTSPLILSYGKSFCDGSPVITTLLFIPILVRNIFICDAVQFCASSNIIMAFLRVLPLMNANGAISMISASTSSLTTFGSIMSLSESNNGLKYGFIFSARSPGRNPRFSPASTAGLTRTIFVICPFISASTAAATARNVFPVPAGPRPNVIMLLFIALRYVDWPMVFGLTSL